MQEQKTSALISEKLLEYLRKQGIKGIGRTSSVATTFAIAESQAQAEALKALLVDYVQSRRQVASTVLGDNEHIDFRVIGRDNRGAVVVSD